MNNINKAILITGLLSSTVLASSYITPINNVEILEGETKNLLIQNISNKQIDVYISGELFNLIPASAVQYSCKDYEKLDLQIMNGEHDSFEVSCQSLIVINEAVTNSKSGE